MATPLIKPLIKNNGGFYTFTSANYDITKTFNNSTQKFRFSKYALLNIPNIKRPTNNQNYIQLNTIDGAIYNNNFNDNNISFIESFQNYCLNLETMILEKDEYNQSERQSVAEKVFFKWLKEIGAIRFREATQDETNQNPTLNKQFVEENNAENIYEKVVKYIGDIQVVNSLVKNGQANSEVYIYVPSLHGNTPVVLFDSKENLNYKQGSTFTGTSEFIQGRNALTIHPFALSINAFYDYDTFNNYANSINANWHLSSSINSYFTESVFGNATNTDIVKSSLDYNIPFTDVAYRRSKLDGININFNLSNYRYASDNPLVQNFNDFNLSDGSSDFVFNAVLIYYDIFDSNDTSNYTTNLYGVMFLNDIKTEVDEGGYIERMLKIKKEQTTSKLGNSYSLTLNFKFDGTNNDDLSITNINDYNSYSMHIFNNVLNSLYQSTKSIVQTENKVISIEDKINSLSIIINSLKDLTSLKSNIKILEDKFINSNLVVDNMQNILDLIDRCFQEINGLKTNPVSVGNFISLLENGNGISLNKGNSSVQIQNTLQQYNSIKKLTFENNLIIYELDLNTNLLLIEELNLTSIKNINIIDNNTFKKGQTIKFYFYNIINGAFGLNIKLNDEMLFFVPFNDLKKELSLICIDENNKKFLIL